LNHLKAKPEARDLLQELMSNIGGGGAGQARAPGTGPESRGPSP
jgi:hypothetical protein